MLGEKLKVLLNHLDTRRWEEESVDEFYKELDELIEKANEYDKLEKKDKKLSDMLRHSLDRESSLIARLKDIESFNEKIKLIERLLDKAKQIEKEVSDEI